MKKESDSPMISVIIPVYNGSATMALCLKSLSECDYPAGRFEIIVVDNNSTDDTRDIILADGRARYLFEKKKGQSSARNTGARNAVGELVAFIDADCLAEREWLAEIVRSLSNGAAAVVGKLAHITRNAGDDMQAEDYRRFWEREAASLRLDKICGSNFAMRREDFLSAGGFDESLLVFEDIELGFRIAAAGGVIKFNPGMVVHHIYLDPVGGRIAKMERHGASEYAVYRKHAASDRLASMMPSFRRPYFRLLERSGRGPMAITARCAAGCMLAVCSPVLMCVLGMNIKAYGLYKFVMNLALFKGKLGAIADFDTRRAG